MTAEEFLSRLEGVKGGGGQWSAKCPAHDDQHNSLSVSIGEDGRVLLKCHAGCPAEEITAALGLTMKDLFAEKSPEYPQILATYNYKDDAGNLLAQKVRYHNKTFAWRRPDGKGGWIYSRQGVPHRLYVAGKFEGLIHVVEGEKDADNFHVKIGGCAVSGADGAGPGKWRKEYTRQLQGCPVVVLCDNDTVGQSYAQEIAAALYGAAKSVRVIDLSQIWPEIPEHGDISDMLEEKGVEDTSRLLIELEKRTPQWEPPNKPDIFESFGFYSVQDLTEEERKPPEFIINGIVPCGMTFLSGAPKTRKSFMALQMAIAVASGNSFLGHDVTKCDVAYFDLEGSKSRISSRTDMMTTSIPRNVHIANHVPDRLASGLVDKLQQLHKSRPALRFIVIDTYSRSRGIVRSGGANAYDVDVSLLEPVQRMALEENIAILFVHHDKKGAGLMSDSFERLSGTMGISGSADCVINLVSDGKRFDGKATMEYTPRDAKGGEVKLAFDDCYGEWREIVEEKSRLTDSPICEWIIKHVPDKKKLGEFYSYDEIFRFAHSYQTNNAGEKVREQLEPYRNELYSSYGIGLQMGVQSNCKRGIRIINLL